MNVRMLRHLVALLLIASASLACAATAWCADPLPRLTVSENRRFLVTEDGRPFFYLGDTTWELFHRLTLDEAREYLDTRAAQGYTVIQAVALAEFDGLHTPNANGHLPLTEDDPTRPLVVDGPDNDYWDHVDAVVAAANERGLYVGLLPTWGDKWNKKWGVGPEIFTPENAEHYGRWIGERYRDAGVIWILGGDREPENDTHLAIVRGLAKGIRGAVGTRQLMTFHPQGGQTSATEFHNDEWLDFNMRQNGHGVEFGSYAGTRSDYDRTPIKPVIDGEPVYEDHPINFDPAKFGHSIAADVRRPIYWDLFQGAFGHTYGHHSIWSFHQAGRQPVNFPLLNWREALAQPGGSQMQHARRLLESRPFLTRVPDDSIIIEAPVATAVRGMGLKRLVATRDSEGTCAMIYTPAGRPFLVSKSAVNPGAVRAWWFNPRDGVATETTLAEGDWNGQGVWQAVPPTPGEQLDWVLVIDEAAKGYATPGSTPLK